MKVRVIAMAGGSIAVAAIVIFAAVASFSQSGSSPADQSNGTRAIVPLDQIVGGGPPRDGIPSIDNPKFVPANDAGLEDFELVLGLDVNGDVGPIRLTFWCGTKS